MKSPRCPECKDQMKPLNAVCRLTSWDIFFHCSCGEVIVVPRNAYTGFMDTDFNGRLVEK